LAVPESWDRPVLETRIGGQTLTVVGRGHSWLVRLGDLEFEGRTIVPLLERALGAKNPQILPIALDALERNARDAFDLLHQAD
jgi:hypothetical protein